MQNTATPTISFAYLTQYLDLLSQHGLAESIWIRAAIQGMQQTQAEYEKVTAEINTELGLEGVSGWDLYAVLENERYEGVATLEEWGLELVGSSATNAQIVNAQQKSLKAKIAVAQAEVEAKAGDAVVALEKLVASNNALSTFTQAVQQYKKYDGLLQKYQLAEQAAESAAAVLSVLTQQEGTLLHLGPDADVALDGNDLFIFGHHAHILFDFGHAGTDRIYFGEDYHLTPLLPHTTHNTLSTENLGALDQLEVFALQHGADVHLYIETESFQGNSVHGFNGEQMILIGVELANLSWQDGSLAA